MLFKRILLLSGNSVICLPMSSTAPAVRKKPRKTNLNPVLASAASVKAALQRIGQRVPFLSCQASPAGASRPGRSQWGVFKGHDGLSSQTIPAWISRCWQRRLICRAPRFYAQMGVLCVSYVLQIINREPSLHTFFCAQVRNLMKMSLQLKIKFENSAGFELARQKNMVLSVEFRSKIAC